MIAEALKVNRKILGFHFKGNYGYINLKGYLIIDENAKRNTIETVSSYKRINGK